MANLITSVRFVLLFLLVTMAYHAPPIWQLVNPFLLIFIIILDAVDGYVARRRGETSVFGSVYDIAVDRAVENVLWIVLADLDLVPIWVALLFITRGIIVDTIRAHGATKGRAAFDMMQSGAGRFLVAGRFMRGLYGTVKAITFAWLLLFHPFAYVYPRWWEGYAETIQGIGYALVLACVILNLARGIPVILEFYLNELRAPRGESRTS